MAFFSTAHELNRRCEQNKNDIEEIYKQGKETNATLNELAAALDNRFAKVDDQFAKVDNRFAKVDDQFAKVDDQFAKVDERFDKVEDRFDGVDTRFDKIEDQFNQVDARFDKIDTHFDRLERFLTSQSPGVDPSSPLDFLSPEHEQSIRLLESKMNLFSRQTRENTDEIARLRQLHAARDVRFDALDSQMAEVLTILRAKSA